MNGLEHLDHQLPLDARDAGEYIVVEMYHTSLIFGLTEHFAYTLLVVWLEWIRLFTLQIDETPDNITQFPQEQIGRLYCFV